MRNRVSIRHNVCTSSTCKGSPNCHPSSSMGMCHVPFPALALSSHPGHPTAWAPSLAYPRMCLRKDVLLTLLKLWHPKPGRDTLLHVLRLHPGPPWSSLYSSRHQHGIPGHPMRCPSHSDTYPALLPHWLQVKLHQEGKEPRRKGKKKGKGREVENGKIHKHTFKSAYISLNTYMLAWVGTKDYKIHECEVCDCPCIP